VEKKTLSLLNKFNRAAAKIMSLENVRSIQYPCPNKVVYLAGIKS